MVALHARVAIALRHVHFALLLNRCARNPVPLVVVANESEDRDRPQPRGIGLRQMVDVLRQRQASARYVLIQHGDNAAMLIVAEGCLDLRAVSV